MPPHTPQSSGPFRVRPTSDALVLAEDLNRQLALITDRLDSRMGFRGAMDVHDLLDMRGNGISNISTQTSPQAAASVAQIQGLQAFLDALQAQVDALRRRVDAQQPFGAVEGTFVVTGTGFAVNPTGTARYVQTGKIVALFLPTLSAVSNATTFTLTGMPATLASSVTMQSPALHGFDGSAHIWTFAELNAGSPILIMRSLPTIRDTADDAGAIIPWTASGTKGVNASVLTWHTF